MAPYPCEKEFLGKVLGVLPDPPEYPAVALSLSCFCIIHSPLAMKDSLLILEQPSSWDSELYALLEHYPPGESTANSLFQVSTLMTPAP